MSRADRKAVFLIIDGLGDLPVPGLGGLTPLEAAATPNLDTLATAGEIGLLDPIGEGVVPNTHSGVAILMGLPPGQTEALRRGPIEAAGAGLLLEAGQVALRSNFASLAETPDGFQIIDRRAGRISEGTAELAALLQDVDLGDDISGSLRPTDDHRGVLVLSGIGLDPAVTDTDPGDAAMPALVATSQSEDTAENLVESRFTAEKINAFIVESYRRLNGHPLNQQRASTGLLPANGVITRSAGSPVNFGNVLNGLNVSTAVVSGCNTVTGLGRFFGFTIFSEPGFTGGLDTDLDGKIDAVLAGLKDHDLVYVHIKATDVCSHDRQPESKRDFLVRLDKSLTPLLSQDIVIGLTADHTTDSNSGMHTADPVPALIWQAGEAGVDQPVVFGESACVAGSMARQKSHDFLDRILEAMHAAGRTG